MQRRLVNRMAAVTAAVTIAALTSAAGAQQGYGQGFDPQSQRQQMGSDQQGAQGLQQLGLNPSIAGRMTSIQGEVTSTKEVAIGDREPYLFATVEDNRGMERIVNLGPVKELGDKINEGDNIDVRAVFLPILGHDVYHTVALRTEDGQSMRVRQIQDPEVRRALGQGLAQRWKQEQQQQRFQQASFRQDRFQQGSSRQGRFQQEGFGQEWPEQRGFQDSGGETGLRQLGLNPANTGRLTSIRGEVTSTKEVGLSGRETYLFATVEDDQGMQRIVNLGPANEAGGNINKGDTIEVRAVYLPILGRNVYHTVALRTEDGRTMRIHQIQDPEVRAAIRQRLSDRWQQGEFQGAGDQSGMVQLGLDPSSTGRMKSIQGEVTSTKEIGLGDRDPYLFAVIEENSGMQRIVNLGPVNEVGNAVSEGDRIEVRAVFLPMLGRPVFHTVALRTEDGQTMRVRQIQDPEVRAAVRQRVGERWQERREQQSDSYGSGD